MSWSGYRDVTTQVLGIVNVAGSHVISRRMMEAGYGGQWSVHAHVSATMGGIVAQMVGYLAADHIETVNISYPRDWWEAVKARFAPAWALKRWPVVETKHAIRLDAVYPKMPLPDKFGPYIRITRHDKVVA